VSRSRTVLRTGTRLLVAAVVVAAPVLLVTSPASATAVVSKAQVSGGSLLIEGQAGVWNAPITVDGVVMTTSDAAGRFKISRSGYTPPADCTVDVSDGLLRPTTVHLNGCTATVATPAMLPDTPEIGPFPVGVDLPTSVVSVPGAIGPVSWRISAGALPAGLSLRVPTPTGVLRDPAPQQLTYAEIVGTPTTAGTSTVTFRATDANGLTATGTYTVRVTPAVPLSITPQPWPTAVAGQFTNLWIDGAGGLRPYRWSVVGGALPPGMTLVQDAVSGPSVRVGGTPTTPGTYDWALQLTDAQGATVTRAFTATVAPAPQATPAPDPSPAPAPAPAFMSIAGLTLGPAGVVGGSPSTGTVTVSTPAPAGGTAVFLSSSSPGVASVPATVTVPEGATSASFPVSTTAVSATTVVTIDATYAGTLSARLSVTAH